jgi:hypothetical protein
MTPPLHEKLARNHQREVRSTAAHDHRAQRTGEGSLLGLHGGGTVIMSMVKRVNERARAARGQAATTRLEVSTALS